MQAFRNRREAGQALALELGRWAAGREVLVLGLPRGGVVPAFEVAKALRAELDVMPVRKLGVPGTEELAMGAIAGGGVRILNHRLIEYLQITPQSLDEVTSREAQELERRERLYRQDRPMSLMHGRTVILVDDGLATGSSMLAAIQLARTQNPRRIVVAVPVAARDTLYELRSEADEVVSVASPRSLGAVGTWYEDFSQVSDEEVSRLLEIAALEFMAESPAGAFARSAAHP